MLTKGVWNIEKFFRLILKSIFFSLALCFIIFGTACRRNNEYTIGKNVEERDYVTVLMIREGREHAYHFTIGIAKEKKKGEKIPSEELSEWEAEDFKDLEQQYEELKGKLLSLSHIKVVMFAMTKYDVESDSFKKLVSLMNENKDIAKTCPVLFLFDQNQFLEYFEKEKKPIGIFLESLIREANEKEIPWIKDYVKALQEGKQIDSYYLRPTVQGLKIELLEGFCI